MDVMNAVLSVMSYANNVIQESVCSVFKMGGIQNQANVSLFAEMD